MGRETHHRVTAMNSTEAIEMMRRASSEIKDLRRQIEHLAPKAAAYDNLAVVLGLLPRPSVGMAEDVAWRLDKRVEELKAEMKGREPAA